VDLPPVAVYAVMYRASDSGCTNACTANRRENSPRWNMATFQRAFASASMANPALGLSFTGGSPVYRGSYLKGRRHISSCCHCQSSHKFLLTFPDRSQVVAECCAQLCEGLPSEQLWPGIPESCERDKAAVVDSVACGRIEQCFLYVTYGGLFIWNLLQDPILHGPFGQAALYALYCLWIAWMLAMVPRR
jgi:hypothetical protein